MVIGNCNKIWFTEIDLSLKNMSRWGEGGAIPDIHLYNKQHNAGEHFRATWVSCF